MAARKKTPRKQPARARKMTRREKSAANKAAHAEARKEIPLGTVPIEDHFELPPCPWTKGEGPTEAVVAIILEAIANHPLASLHAIHRKDPAYPAPGTWCDWVARDTELRERYARAREMQADAFAEQEAVVTAGLHRKAAERDTQGAIQRDKLRSDGMRWAAGHLNPRRYRPSVKLEHEGEVKLPVQVDLSKLSSERLEQLLEISREAAPAVEE